MRIRCIAFLPPAALITCVQFLLASSFVSTVESTVAPVMMPFIVPAIAAGAATPTIELIRFETECEGLRRRIEELARVASSCDAHPGCLRSPILCPIVMGQDLELEYDRLRSAAQSRCTGLPTYATRAGRSCPVGDDVCEARLCSAWDVWAEEVAAPDRPTIFLF
ncbi:MAG: hypothetical protein V3T64_04545 [Myxococcota bacterium]